MRNALWVLGLVVTLPFGSAAGQTTSGSLRGVVTSEDGRPLTGATITLVHPATGAERTATTGARGFYQFVGLRPGSYEARVRMVGYRPVFQAVDVGVGQTLQLDFALTQAAVELEAIEVVSAPAAELHSSEAATNISQEQIQSIPLNDRNFLSLALLAPGITTCSGGCPPGDQGSISSGAESANNVNVFVDGVSFKNEILKGGVAGQDASKGNPFPQVAVEEFRVITQQFKAEYQKATSAIVTATTRSGTNQWEGSLFTFRQGEGLIAQDYFAVQQCEEAKEDDPTFECAPKPELSKWQIGGSLGGPIVRDELFFFGAYEGNHQTRSATVTPTGLAQWPADIQTELQSHAGTFESPFRSNLFFGKLTWLPGPRHRVELSGNVRDEYDVRNFGGDQGFENAEDFNNDVNTFLLKHQYNSGGLLNEAQVSYQRYRWYPVQLRTDLIGRQYEGSLKIGGRCCPQDQTQKRLEFRNDVSYAVAGGLGHHLFKVGANLDFVEYDVFKQLQVNPQYTFNAATPDFPIRGVAGFGEPFIGANNTQLGVYLQDDWSPTQRLTLNLGLRWDYESNGLNNDYITPPEVVTEVGSRDDLIIIDDDYFTDGDDRPAFKRAFQPRLGFSFDLTGRNQTVVFGGFGVYYDRNSYATTIGERERLVWQVYTFNFSADGSVPGTIAWDDSYFTREGLESIVGSGTTGLPEVFLMDNNTRPPRSNHFSLGVRQAVQDFLFSLQYTGVRTYNQFTWMFANRAPDGSTFRLPSYQNVLVSTDEGRSWYDALYFKAEKRYTARSRWGAQLAYTLSWADATVDAGRDFGGLSFTTPDDFVRRNSERDERHRVTANWIIGLPLDFRFSGLLSLGSGRPYRVFYGGNACTTGNMDCIGNEYPGGDPSVPWGGTNPFTGEPERHSFLGIPGWAFRNVDLRLEKEFHTVGRQRIGLFVEVFNVFNYANFNGYIGRIADLQPPPNETELTNENDEFGEPNSAISDIQLPGAPRRFQFGLRYTL